MIKYLLYLIFLMTCGSLVGWNFANGNTLESVVASVILFVFIYKSKDTVYRWL